MSARQRPPVITKRIANGLNEIYAYMDAVHSARENSTLDCTCKACRAGQDDCRCESKTYGRKCQGCRDYEDQGLALSWLGTRLDLYHGKRR